MSIYVWLAKRNFPKPVRLGGGRNSWLESDLAAWEKMRVEDATPQEYVQPEWAKPREASDGTR